MEEPRDPVALQTAVPHFLTEHEVAAADGVSPVREVVFQRAKDLFPKLGCDALIGVDVKDPLVPGAVDLGALKTMVADARKRSG